MQAITDVVSMDVPASQTRTMYVDLDKLPRKTKIMKKLAHIGVRLGRVKITFKGPVTVAEVEYKCGWRRGTMVGVAMCHDDDIYNEEYGGNLAVARALRSIYKIYG